jgi:two-component system, chemotaxis family, protein-glutamate methylesterase/glutaminase
MPKLRALVVDDSIVMRKLITDVLNQDAGIEVVGSASNGKIALQKLPQVNPDFVTLDVEMPEMDGVAALRELRKTYPRLPVLMFSAVTQRGASATLEALAAGANDYVTKPQDSFDLADSMAKLKEDLVPKIYAHCRRPPAAASISRADVPDAPARELPKTASGPVDLLCIGSSTGGPIALEALFKGFRQPLPVPVAIVQHMPPMFTLMLAQRLDALRGPLGCLEAEEGVVLQPGKACLARGGCHLSLSRSAGGFVTHLTDAPPENSCKPAVDVLFRAAAQTGANVLSVVLTGMGQDGMRGCQHVRERGGQVIAQDQATSVVWGMPGAVAQAGLAHAILPLGEIAGEIARRLSQGRVLLRRGP